MPDISRIRVHPSVTAFDPPTLVEALSGLAPEVVVVDDDPGTLVDFDAVVTLEHREAFLGAGVSWVHLSSAGVDHFPVERYRSAGVVVTNSSGVHSECMAENVLGLMLTTPTASGSSTRGRLNGGGAGTSRGARSSPSTTSP